MDSSDRDAHLAIARRPNRLMDGRGIGEEQGLYLVLPTGIVKDNVPPWVAGHPASSDTLN